MMGIFLLVPWIVRSCKGLFIWFCVSPVLCDLSDLSGLPPTCTHVKYSVLEKGPASQQISPKNLASSAESTLLLSRMCATETATIAVFKLENQRCCAALSSLLTVSQWLSPKPTFS